MSGGSGPDRRRSMMRAEVKRIFALLSDPRNRERMLQEMNQENMDDVGPIGGQEEGMRVLQELNESGLAQEDIYRDVSRITIRAHT
jgi:hypothetical protein